MTLLKDELRAISAINYENGLVYMLNDKLYLKHLRSYKGVLDDWLQKKLGGNAEEELERFVIDVHALKSNSRSVGADTLSAKAAELERLGRDKDVSTVMEKLPCMMEDVAELDVALAKLFSAHSEGGGFSGTRVDAQAKKLILSEISIALADFDMDAVETKLDELKQFQLSEFAQKAVEELIAAADTFEYDQAEELVSRLMQEIM